MIFNGVSLKIYFISYEEYEILNEQMNITLYLLRLDNFKVSSMILYYSVFLMKQYFLFLN